MPQMDGATFLANALKEYGLTHAFFVPSILCRTVVEFERQTDIARITPHGEKPAAYMADGYARASGRPGLCMAQAVGGANLAAGLKDAYLASSPVIAIAGGPNADTRAKNVYQEVDDYSSFAPVTKFRSRVDTLEALPDLLAQAYRSATTGRPGPVHLEFHGHYGQHIDTASADLEAVAEAAYAVAPAFRPRADPEAIAEAVRKLKSASKPVIVAGGGVARSSAQAELVELAESLSIPVATSLSGKGAIPDNHPLAVGVSGFYARQCANEIVSEADVVLFVGSRAGSLATNFWSIPTRDRTIIQIDILPEEIGRNYPGTVGLLGDVREVLKQLLEATPADRVAGGDESGHGKWSREVESRVDEWKTARARMRESDAEALRPERVCRELSEALPSDGVVVSDTGHAAIWAGTMIDLSSPDQRFYRAAGSLGWSVPASIGVKAALPDRAVCVFTGDGGFWYHLSEVETAVRAKLPVVIVINNNRSMNQETVPYSEAYGGQLEGRHEELWKFEDVNFAQMAEAMGARGVRATTGEQVREAIERGFRENRPTVVDAVTDIEAVVPTGVL